MVLAPLRGELRRQAVRGGWPPPLSPLNLSLPPKQSINRLPSPLHQPFHRLLAFHKPILRIRLSLRRLGLHYAGGAALQILPRLLLAARHRVGQRFLRDLFRKSILHKSTLLSAGRRIGPYSQASPKTL